MNRTTLKTAAEVATLLRDPTGLRLKNFMAKRYVRGERDPTDGRKTRLLSATDALVAVVLSGLVDCGSSSRILQARISEKMYAASKAEAVAGILAAHFVSGSKTWFVSMHSLTDDRFFPPGVSIIVRLDKERDRVKRLFESRSPGTKPKLVFRSSRTNRAA